MDKLSQEKIQQLLAAVGSRPNACTNEDAVVFDWKQPRYFNSEQLARLQVFAEAVAAECKTEFFRLYQDDVEVSVVTAEQCFWDGFAEQHGTACYRMMLGNGSQPPLGLIHIPESSADAWIGQMLGTSELSREEGKLSELEESLLLDIAANLTQALSRAYRNGLQLDKQIYDAGMRPDLTGSDELFMITFEVRQADSEQAPMSASFLMCCDKLQVLIEEGHSEKPVRTVDYAGIMRQHIDQQMVPLTVQLGKATLLFKDVLNLEPDDVFVMDNSVTDPVSILINNKHVFCGRPARTGEHYAVIIE